MAMISVRDVKVTNNPAGFLDDFQFEILFDCVSDLNDGSGCEYVILSLIRISVDLEWKLVYVGSAESEEGDQELTSVLVGPIPQGLNRFELSVCFVIFFVPH